MPKSKKKKWPVVAAVLICAVIVAIGTIYTTCPKRAVKKALCAESPVMCRCYENIVDYRMSDREIAITNRYQSEMKNHGPISPLEFATMEEVQHLSAMLGVCEMEQAQQFARQAAAQKMIPVAQPVVPVQPIQQQNQSEKK